MLWPAKEKRWWNAVEKGQVWKLNPEASKIGGRRYFHNLLTSCGKFGISIHWQCFKRYQDREEHHLGRSNRMELKKMS